MNGSDTDPAPVDVDVTDSKPPANARIKGFAAGTVSGITKLIVGHPFDTIKVRLQCAEAGVYRGAFDCLKQTVSREGLRALYKGASPPAVSWAASDSCLMGSMNAYRMALAKREALAAGRPMPRTTEGLSITGHGLAAWGAGLTVCSIVTPFENLKAKLQMQTTAEKKIYSGPIHAAKRIIEVQGPLGLYKGFGATLMFRSSFGPMFAANEWLLQRFKRDRPSMNRSLANFLAGGLSSNVFWLTALPADSIKNRIMADSITKPSYTSIAQCARVIYKEGGPRAFYKGFVPAILRASPANGMALLMWDLTYRAISE